MNISGTVIQSLGIQSGVSKSGKEWKRAEVLIETTENSQYPKKVKLANMKDAEKFAMLTPGAEGVFFVEVESREWQGKWYTDVNCWKWNITGNEAAGYTTVQEGQPQREIPVAQPYSGTPNLDSLGVKGYQPQGMAQNFPPNPNPNPETDDLPF